MKLYKFIFIFFTFLYNIGFSQNFKGVVIYGVNPISLVNLDKKEGFSNPYFKKKFLKKKEYLNLLNTN